MNSKNSNESSKNIDQIMIDTDKFFKDIKKVTIYGNNDSIIIQYKSLSELEEKFSIYTFYGTSFEINFKSDIEKYPELIEHMKKMSDIVKRSIKFLSLHPKFKYIDEESIYDVRLFLMKNNKLSIIFNVRINIVFISIVLNMDHYGVYPSLDPVIGGNQTRPYYGGKNLIDVLNRDIYS